jgi:hypothetical protein
MDEGIKRNTDQARAGHESPASEATTHPLELLKRDVALVTAFLDDPDPARRQSALHIAMLYWKHVDALKHRIMKAAREDNDTDVRIGAIQALWAFHRANPSRSLQSFLASFVRDEAEGAELRKIAYYTLLLTNGRTDQSGPRSIRLRFPEDVDWSFVGDYAE